MMENTTTVKTTAEHIEAVRAEYEQRMLAMYSRQRAELQPLADELDAANEALDAAFKLERATTKAEYIAHCTEMKPLIVAWGWQKEIKAHYADWCKRKGL
jgi:hypothetical protein